MKLKTTASYGEEVEFEIRPCEFSRHENRGGEIVEIIEKGYKVVRVSIDGKEVKEISSDVRYWILSAIETETGCVAVEIKNK